MGTGVPACPLCWVFDDMSRGTSFRFGYGLISALTGEGFGVLGTYGGRSLFFSWWRFTFSNRPAGDGDCVFGYRARLVTRVRRKGFAFFVWSTPRFSYVWTGFVLFRGTGFGELGGLFVCGLVVIDV